MTLSFRRVLIRDHLLETQHLPLGLSSDSGKPETYAGWSRPNVSKRA